MHGKGGHSDEREEATLCLAGPEFFPHEMSSFFLCLSDAWVCFFMEQTLHWLAEKHPRTNDVHQSGPQFIAV